MTHRVAVIGGGPAGLIAAEVLAAAGHQVDVYDARRSPGRKFLLAGRGGLNITHSESKQEFLSRYGDDSERMARVIEGFSPTDLRSWCDGLGEPTFVGTSGRVFPEAFRATSLLRSWLLRLQEQRVAFHLRHRWIGWNPNGELEFETPTRTHAVHADAVVFALGGASWPRVGGDGSWVEPFERRGINVAALQPANCGVTVAWSDIMRNRFAGEPIKNTVFSIDNHAVRGDAVVTTDGLEGGPIYALGPFLRAAESAVLTLDTQPDLAVSSLAERLSKRTAKASATRWLSSAGVPPVSVALVRETTGNAIPNDPAALAVLLKALPIETTGMASLDRAISSAGGVAMAQLDEGLMLTEHPGMFVAGEMLDWEAPTGGYLLQGCFSTGVAAARGVTAWLASGRPSAVE